MNRQHKQIAIGAAAALWACASLALAASSNEEQASLPQASHRITNWALDGTKGLWVEALGKHWYYAEFLGPCPGAGTGDAIAFKFSPGGSLDRNSQVILRRPTRRTCAIRSFVASNGPPTGHKVHSSVAEKGSTGVNR